MKYIVKNGRCRILMSMHCHFECVAVVRLDISVCRNPNPIFCTFMTYIFCNTGCINSNAMGTTSGTGTAYSSPAFQFLVEFVLLSRQCSLTVQYFANYCMLFCCQLYCLFFFNLRLLIITFVSSNFSSWKIEFMHPHKTVAKRIRIKTSKHMSLFFLLKKVKLHTVVNFQVRVSQSESGSNVL